jgi:FMN phosphatase YigB (HAD superfamily)
MEPAGTPDIRGIIFDLDHTLYQHSDMRFELYALATAQAALNMGLSATFEQAKAIAVESNAETGGEFTHFVERHGLPPRELLHEYDKVAARIFPDYVHAVEGLTDKFNRLSPDRPRAVLTHSSSHWMEPMIRHVGLGSSFDPRLLFPQDHPDIKYRKKNESPEVFELVAQQMGVPMHQIAVVEDTAKNLILPYLLGMYTVLVTWGEEPEEELPWVCETVNNVSDFLRPEIFPELGL